jgi:hypothetical protein
MTFAVLLLRTLEVAFFAGMVGSVVVVLISFFDDFKELLRRD